MTPSTKSSNVIDIHILPTLHITVLEKCCHPMTGYKVAFPPPLPYPKNALKINHFTKVYERRWNFFFVCYIHISLIFPFSIYNILTHTLPSRHKYTVVQHHVLQGVPINCYHTQRAFNNLCRSVHLRYNKGSGNDYWKPCMSIRLYLSVYIKKCYFKQVQ